MTILVLNYYYLPLSVPSISHPQDTMWKHLPVGTNSKDIETSDRFSRPVNYLLTVWVRVHIFLCYAKEAL